MTDKININKNASYYFYNMVLYNGVIILSYLLGNIGAYPPTYDKIFLDYNYNLKIRALAFVEVSSYAVKKLTPPSLYTTFTDA